MNEVTSNELPGTEKLEELIELALAEAGRLGVDQVEVAASRDKGLSTTVRLGEVESLEYSNDRGVWVTVYRNSRKGSASTSENNTLASSCAILIRNRSTHCCPA